MAVGEVQNAIDARRRTIAITENYQHPCDLKGLFALNRGFSYAYGIMSREALDKFIPSKSLLHEPHGTYDRYNYHATPLDAYRWKAYQIGCNYYQDTTFDTFYLICMPLAAKRFDDYEHK